MPVPITPPIQVAPVPGRTFDQWFYTSFQVLDITPTGGRIAFAKIPMNSQTGDVYPELAKGIQCDLWDAVASVPEAAAAFTSVLEALPAIEEWKNNQ